MSLVRRTDASTVLIIACGALIAIIAPPAKANSLEEHQADNAARTALGRGSRFPWYDKTQDQPHPVPAPEFSPQPGSPAWIAKQQPPKGQSWDLEGFWRIVQYGLWVVLAIAFAALIYFSLNSRSRRRLAGATKPQDANALSNLDEELIQRLPFPIKRPRQDLLAEARRSYQQGNLRDAIIYLFSYELLQLDRHQLIQLTRGKTNRQYLADIRPLKPLRELVGRTMRAFEDVFFGHHDLQPERFEAIWRELPEFERLLQGDRT